MKKTVIIVTIALICVIGLSVVAYAVQETNIWDKIFNNDNENITFDELDTARDELIKLELSPEEFDERGKKLKEVISDKEEDLPKIENQKQDTDTLIDRIKRDIAFFEESINYDQTINDKVRDRQETHIEDLQKLLPLVEAKEKSYEDYFSEYESLRLKYIEDYKELRD